MLIVTVPAVAITGTAPYHQFQFEGSSAKKEIYRCQMKRDTLVKREGDQEVAHKVYCTC